MQVVISSDESRIALTLPEGVDIMKLANANRNITFTLNPYVLEPDAPALEGTVTLKVIARIQGFHVIPAIKTLREITGLGLTDSKYIVKDCPLDSTFDVLSSQSKQIISELQAQGVIIREA